MVTRLQEIMKYEGLSPAKFAEMIGVNRAAMSHFMSGRNNPSMGVVIKILESFPYIDPMWLLMGSGAMFKADDKHGSSEVPEEDTVVNNQKNNVFTDGVADEEPANVLIDSGCKQSASDEGKSAVHESTPSPSLEPMRESLEPKKVVKVIIYYSDQTFTSLSPDKSPFLF